MWGTPPKRVMRSCSTMRRIASGVARRRYTTVAPIAIGSRLKTMAPEICHTGSGLPKTSRSCQLPCSNMEPMLLIRLRWVSITAFGMPVVPEVQNKPATPSSAASGLAGRHRELDSLQLGPVHLHRRHQLPDEMHLLVNQVAEDRQIGLDQGQHARHLARGKERVDMTHDGAGLQHRHEGDHERRVVGQEERDLHTPVPPPSSRRDPAAASTSSPTSR